METVIEPTRLPQPFSTKPLSSQREDAPLPPPREVQGQGIAGRSRGMLGHLAKYPWVLGALSLDTWASKQRYLGGVINSRVEGSPTLCLFLISLDTFLFYNLS